MSIKLPTLSLLLLAATGCSSVTETTSSGATTGGSANSESYSVKFGPVNVAPGQERTQCVTLRLGNPAPLHVGKIHNSLTEGSHHVIIYRTNDTEERLTPYSCQPFTDTLKPDQGSPLMITQKQDELLELPKGVAYTLEANQMIRVEMHYINPTGSDLEIGETTTFMGIPDAEYKNEAGFLFLGNPDISIPPHQKMTLGPTFIQMSDDLADVNFFGITGHTHQWGTDVTVSTAASMADTSKDVSVYSVPGWQWSEPKTVYQDPPFQLPKDGGFRFSCSWNNQSAQTAEFGESANDEMCFFWAYYYPTKGSFVCLHTDQVKGGFDLCCPGNPLCDKLIP